MRKRLGDWLHRKINDIENSDWWEDIHSPICRWFSHQTVDDQCGAPEHRYCVWCRTLAVQYEQGLTKEQAVEVYKAGTKRLHGGET